MQAIKHCLLSAIGIIASFQAVGGEAITYYHSDLIGSPIAATDQAGYVRWRAAYRPYGDRDQTASEQLASADNKKWFTGHVHDEETGLTYAGARYYDPTLGRFLSTDPVGFKVGNDQSFGRYAYANNNPYKYVDPTGAYGQGSGFTSEQWKQVYAAQQRAAGRMESTASSLDSRAGRLERRGKDSTAERSAAEFLRSGAAALRSDGSDGKIAYGLSGAAYAARGPSAGSVAVVPGRGSVMFVNTDHDVWTDPSMFPEGTDAWVVGHESLHTAGLTDMGIDTIESRAFGTKIERQVFSEFNRADLWYLKPDNLMQRVLPQVLKEMTKP